MNSTLVLNATYEPIQIISWQRAVRMLFQNKVEVVAEYKREIRSISLTIKMPSVLRLLHYVRLRPDYSRIRFSRANVYARDNHTCQYCSRRLKTEQLTYDHIVPVARGGEKTWENIVTCCVSCNHRKGNRTPGEAGLRLSKKPKAPNGFHYKIRLQLNQCAPPESWKDFIFWNLEVGIE